MKFVYFGYDFLLDGVQQLLDDGHELLGAFTFECDNVFNFNIETIKLVKGLDMPAILSRPEDIHISSFLDRGAEVFLAAGYPYKIPPVDPAYGLNLHPSLLPKGRGMMPTPTIIMDEPEAAGFTIHKLAEDYDAGDILYQEALPLAEDETVDIYSARIAKQAPKALSKIMADLPKYWNEAKPQNHEEASTFPTPDDAMRTLSWSMGVEQIDKIARAFGSFGCLCTINGKLTAIYDLEIRKEEHGHTPGHIINHIDGGLEIAVQGGVVHVKRYQSLENAA